MASDVLKTVKPGGGGDYTTLQAWYDARTGDLVARDTHEIAEVYGGGSVGALLMVNGADTTDATRFFEIRAAAGEAHSGTFNTGKAYLTSAGLTLRTFAKFTRVIGLCVETSDGSDATPALGAFADDGLFDRCLIRNPNGYAVSCFPRHGGHPNTFENCVLLHGTGANQDCFDAGPADSAVGECAVLLNCAAIQLKGGVVTLSSRATAPPGAAIRTQNCYLHSATPGSIYGGPGGYTKGDHDATSDTEAVTAGLRNVAFSTANFVNVAYSTLDLHITISSAVYNAGTDLSGTFTDDFEGDPRGGWSIGPDEIPGVNRLFAAPFAALGNFGAHVSAVRSFKALLDPLFEPRIQFLAIPEAAAGAPERISRIKSDGSLDFPTLASWWAARKGNLVARGVREVAEVYGGGSVGDLVTERADAIVDQYRYFQVRAARGEDHGGVFNTAKAYVNGLQDNPFWIRVPFFRVGPGISVRSTVNLPEVVGNPHCVIVADMQAGEYVIVDGIIAACAGGNVFRAEYCDLGTLQIFQNCLAMRADGNSSTGFRATNARMSVRNSMSWTGDDACFADNDGGAFGPPAADGIIETENCYFVASRCYGAAGGGSHVVQGAKDFTASAEATDPARRNLAPAAAGLTNPVLDALDARLLLGSILVAAGATLADVLEDFQRNGRAAPYDVGPDQLVSVRGYAAAVQALASFGVALTTERTFYEGGSEDAFSRPSFGAKYTFPSYGRTWATE